MSVGRIVCEFRVVVSSVVGIVCGKNKCSFACQALYLTSDLNSRSLALRARDARHRLVCTLAISADAMRVECVAAFHTCTILHCIVFQRIQADGANENGCIFLARRYPSGGDLDTLRQFESQSGFVREAECCQRNNNQKRKAATN